MSGKGKRQSRKKWDAYYWSRSERANRRFAEPLLSVLMGERMAGLDEKQSMIRGGQPAPDPRSTDPVDIQPFEPNSKRPIKRG